MRSASSLFPGGAEERTTRLLYPAPFLEPLNTQCAVSFGCAGSRLWVDRNGGGKSSMWESKVTESIVSYRPSIVGSSQGQRNLIEGSPFCAVACGLCHGGLANKVLPYPEMNSASMYSSLLGSLEPYRISLLALLEDNCLIIWSHLYYQLKESHSESQIMCLPPKLCTPVSPSCLVFQLTHPVPACHV